MHFTFEQRQAWQEKTKDSPFNQWLRERTSSAEGGLDLELLRGVADEFGVDWRRYTTLNPGQQRMNIGNRLRGAVPPAIYAHGPETDDREPVLPASQIAPMARDIVTSGHWAFMGSASNRDLLKIQSLAVAQLKRRGIVRTKNNPVGDYAETLFARAFNWVLAKSSAAHFDATDRSGRKFQIKARVTIGQERADRQLSIFRALPDAGFDYLAAVLFDKDFLVHRAVLVPYAIVMEAAKYVVHVNGWRFHLVDSVWDHGGVEDVTDILSYASRTDGKPAAE